MIYNYNKQSAMQKKIDLSRRAESLNIYKPPKSLELPRFYSRPKKTLLTNKNENQEFQPNINNENKNSLRLSKAEMANIVNKIKQKRNGTKSREKKPISEKKITVFNRYESQSSNRDKPSKRLNNNNLEIKGENLKQQILTGPRRQETAANEKAEGTPKKMAQQYKSKSLKNAVRYQNQQYSSVNNLQNKNQNKIVKIEIKPKNYQSQLPIQRRKTKSNEESLKIEYNSEYTTEPTQPNQLVSEIERKVCKKIVQIFLNITLDPGNLDWPQQYIVMQKFMMQKKLYQILQETQNSPIKSKVRKHFCLSRISIYMYSSMILNQLQIKCCAPIFTKLHESFLITNQIMSYGNYSLNPEKIATLNRNNEFTAKMLVKLLSKKTTPHNNLLKNMLQSSLKIQSIEFMEILDKTLKWEILKMPSYPYLPPSSKQLFLVLDLDQTLIHYDYDAQLFHVRPFAEQFLKKVSALYQITIFTAALQQYADQILNEIDPEHCISYKLYRNHLTYIQDVPIKDLSMLGRPLNKTIIVDNIATNYRMQPQNGIQIRTWYNDDNDEVLGKLYAFLLKISTDYRDDVRVGIRQFGQFIKQQITKSNLIYELQKEL